MLLMKSCLEQFSEDFMTTRDQPFLDVREAFLSARSARCQQKPLDGSQKYQTLLEELVIESLLTGCGYNYYVFNKTPAMTPALYAKV
jgi:hypothetical protein